MLPNFNMWGYSVEVTWAEPDPVPGMKPREVVPALHFANLPAPLSLEELMQIFNQNSFGGVCNICKLVMDGRPVVLAYFRSRTQAEIAKVALNRVVVAGKKVKVSWAHPITGKPFLPKY